jgi:hypothetical protein
MPVASSRAETAEDENGKSYPFFFQEVRHDGAELRVRKGRLRLDLSTSGTDTMKQCGTPQVDSP